MNTVRYCVNTGARRAQSIRFAQMKTVRSFSKGANNDQNQSECRCDMADGAGRRGIRIVPDANNRTMIAAAPRERSGGASGMLGTARLLGQTTGAALVSLFLARYPLEGTRISRLAGVGFALLGGALSS